MKRSIAGRSNVTFLWRKCGTYFTVRMFRIFFKKCFRGLLGFRSLINCDGEHEHGLIEKRC